MIIIFIISLIFLAYISKIKSINLISIYGNYFLFSALYNIIPYLASQGALPVIYSLTSEEYLVNLQLLVAAFCNICFGIVYYFNYRNVIYYENKHKNKLKFLYAVFYLIIFLLTLYFTYRYGWHEYSHFRDENYSKEYTLTAYLKYFFTAAYLFYLYKYKLDALAVIFLLLQVAVMFVDGARTLVFGILILTLNIFLHKEKAFKNKLYKKNIYIVFVVGIFGVITTRALVMEGGFIDNLLISILIEAEMGSYMVLQTIYTLLNQTTYAYTWGTTYIIDPIIWLLPPEYRLDTLTYNIWVGSSDVSLDDEFSPMGGFYYIAEGLSSIPIIGPVIVTYMYAKLSVRMENNKNNYRAAYLLYIPTIGVLFIKHIFGNLTKMFLIVAIFFAVIDLVYKFIFTIVMKKKDRTSID